MNALHEASFAPSSLAAAAPPSLAIQLTFFFFLVFLLVSGILIRSVFFLHRRNAEMEALAGRLSFQASPDNVLPLGISLQGTPFQQWTELSNIHHGLVNGMRVVMMDFHKKEGNETWSRTIIGANTDRPLRKPYDIEMRQIGNWQVFYTPVHFHRCKELLEIDRIDIVIKSFGRS